MKFGLLSQPRPESTQAVWRQRHLLAMKSKKKCFVSQLFWPKRVDPKWVSDKGDMQ